MYLPSKTPVPNAITMARYRKARCRSCAFPRAKPSYKLFPSDLRFPVMNTPRIRRLGSKLPERLKRHRRKEGDDAVCKQVSQAAREERQQGKSQCLKIRNPVLRTKTISSAQRIRHVSCHDNARKEGAYGNEVANDTADISSRKREHQENVVSRLSVCKHAAMQQIGKRIHMPASKGDDQPKGNPLRDGLGWCLPTDRPTRRLPQPRPHRCSREPWRNAPAQALR